MDQPIRFDDPIHRDARCELTIVDQYLVTYLRLILFLKSTRIMTTDLKAANHVLFNSYDYPKSEIFRRIIRGLFGSGAFFCINRGIP